MTTSPHRDSQPIAGHDHLAWEQHAESGRLASTRSAAPSPPRSETGQEFGRARSNGLARQPEKRSMARCAASLGCPREFDVGIVRSFGWQSEARHQQPQPIGGDSQRTCLRAHLDRLSRHLLG